MKKFLIWIGIILVSFILLGIIIDYFTSPEEKIRLQREREIKDSLNKIEDYKKDSLKQLEKINTEKSKISDYIKAHLNDYNFNIRGFLNNNFNIKHKINIYKYSKQLIIKQKGNEPIIEVSGWFEGEYLTNKEQVSGSFISVVEIIGIDKENLNDMYKLIDLTITKNN